MKILLLQLDGKLPNLALMRIGQHHREMGDAITIRFGAQFEKEFADAFDRVYASAIFKKTAPLIDRLKVVYPEAARLFALPALSLVDWIYSTRLSAQVRVLRRADQRGQGAARVNGRRRLSRRAVAQRIITEKIIIQQ